MGKKYISELHEDVKRVQLGMISSHRWQMDPKVLMFSMSRYKFVTKMLSGLQDVIEVGCGDGLGSQMVAREVGKIRAYDLDPKLVDECNAMIENEKLTFEVWDFVEKPVAPKADAAYLLDVLEHIPQEQEGVFLKNVVDSIKPEGVCIVGMPSQESQAYASEPSKKSHVNCKSGSDFKKVLENYFSHVFLFSMNDEMVHTGFSPMAHYLMTLCVDVKKG